MARARSKSKVKLDGEIETAVLADPVVVDVQTTTTESTVGPWWARAISTFGVPAAIAMYLVYSLVVGQSDSLRNVAARLDVQNEKPQPLLISYDRNWLCLMQKLPMSPISCDRSLSVPTPVSKGIFGFCV